MVASITGRSRGGFLVPEIAPIQVDTAESSMAADGTLVEPLTVTRYSMMAYGNQNKNSIKHYDSLGTTSFVIRLQNIGKLMPYPGGCLMFTQEDCYDYTDHGFAITSGADNIWIFAMAITQMGVFYQDYTLPNDEFYTKYVPKFIHDYQNTYDFMPWVGPGAVPWGDTTEVWSVKKTRTMPAVDGKVSEMWYLSGDKHPGQEWTAGPVLVAEGVRTYCASGWGWAPESDFSEVVPTDMQIVGCNVILEDAGGVAPAAPVGAAAEPVAHSGVVGWHTAFAAPLTADGATGFACRWYPEAPLPLAGVFTANPSPPVRYQQDRGRNSYEVSEALPGVNNLYVWAVNDQLTVGPSSTIPFFFMDVTIDGSNQGSVGRTHGNPPHGTLAHYRVGQTAIVEGGVLDMITPNAGDAITWQLSGGNPDNDLFEIVNGVLRFKAPAEVAQVSDEMYRINLTATDEHALEAGRGFLIARAM